jgi:Flp pilus assembly protein TadG
MIPMNGQPQPSFRGTGAPRRRCGVRRGVAAVEFAFVAPLFFLLILGTIEIGRAMMVQQILVNASRVGARRAITLSSSEQAVTDAVSEYMAGVGIDGAEVSVSPNPATAAGGTAITVDVEIDYSEVSWLPAPWFMGGKQLVACSVMRKEGF